MEPVVRLVIFCADVVVVTTRHASAEGHEMGVRERQSETGRVASRADVVEAMERHIDPWSGPWIPVRALKWAFRRQVLLKFRPTTVRGMFEWMRHRWQKCSVEQYSQGGPEMVVLVTCL